MPSITRSEVERLAHLARLELSEDQVQRFTRQLGDILEFARQVNAVDTSAIDAADFVGDADDRTRDDTVQPSLSRDEALRAAPDADPVDGLFKVPRVLNG
ncbi:MAG TPA: Asp-tRNA(Asn)/Glu-tRNA(Gln) amidotransferase subunit GatC [Vicinamibacterales bacterium]